MILKGRDRAGIFKAINCLLGYADRSYAQNLARLEE